MTSLLQALGLDVHQALEAMLCPGGTDHRAVAARLLQTARREYDEAWPRPKLLSGMWSMAGASAQALPEEKRNDWLRSATTEVLPYLHSSVLWAESGFPALDLTLDYFTAIGVTDFGECGEEALRLPFPQFVMRFPENVQLGGVRSAFVYPLHAVEPIESTEDEALLKIGHRYRATLGASETLTGDRRYGIYTEWDAEPPVDAFLHTAARDLRNLHERAASRQALKVFRLILANTVLYIGSTGGVPPPRKHPHGAPPEPIEGLSKTEPHYRVGRPIKLGPQMRQLAEQHKGSAWKLAARFVVRGHWRMQAYGPARSLRRRQWIQPFWKGPATLGEALERTYEVQ